ncbi:MAG: M12 family metallopeptidase [Pirellulales bacterium]
MSSIVNTKCNRLQWLLCSCCLLAFLSNSVAGQTRRNRPSYPRSGGFRIESKIPNGGSISTNGGAGQSGPVVQGKLVTGKVRMQSGKALSVEYVVRDGLAFFQGDIMLGKVDSQSRVTGSRSPFSRANITKDWRRWPNGEIPYEIHNSLNDSSIRIRDWLTNQTVTIRTGVYTAIKRWNDQTNITIRPRRGTDRDYVQFKLNPKSDGRSWSRLGREGGRQSIVLDSETNLGIIQHEIGHTAGLWHEQSREDRNQFIKIEWDNIIDDRNIKHQYKIQRESGDMSGQYDYDSIMHYPSMANSHAKDPNKPVITTRNGVSRNRLGQQIRLSRGDIAAINAFYPEPTWTGSAKIPQQTSKTGPAMAVFQGRLYMVHLGKKSNDIYYSYFNGSTWTKNVKIPGQKSKATPALVSFRNELQMLHLGNSSNDIWHSRFNGSTWTKNVKIPGQTSKATPAMAVYQARLHMVHLGKSSNNIWHSIYNGSRWSTNVKINSQQSKVAPSLSMFNGELYMFHLGNRSNDIWYSKMDPRGIFLPNIRVPRETSSRPVAVAEFANQLILVHRGGGSSNLYKNSYAELPSTMPIMLRRGQPRRGGTYRTGKVAVKRRP